jgi:hypothetical protein
MKVENDMSDFRDVFWGARPNDLQVSCDFSEFSLEFTPHLMPKFSDFAPICTRIQDFLVELASRKRKVGRVSWLFEIFTFYDW